jgi:DNA-binding transcriptional LysR family regulator
MELRHLRYFVAVAEERNFTRAAAGLHVAQSALSQQIARLEAEVGAALLHRTSRAVGLTEAGTVLLPLARRILADAEHAQAELDALAGLHRGTLRLGVVQSQAVSLDVLEIVGDFHERHPGVRFQIMDDTSTRMAELVAGGGLDLAVVGLEASEAPAGLRLLPLGHEPLVAVLPTSSQLAARDRVGAAEVAAVGQFIRFKRGSGLRSRVDATFARAGVHAPGAFEMSQISDLLYLVARGVGVTILPRSRTVLEGEVRGVRFAVVELDDPLARHPVGLLFDPPRLSAAAAAFVDEVGLRIPR